ncbi:MAG: PAS domain S-box protein [Candidatus Rokubacteria bacterium]|nr:PAS domain S-box protein [Candidatus Rokubacteria bacterium]
MSLNEHELRDRAVLHGNGHPMWVYDVETLRFIAVNDAAVKHYGYSRAEFLSMTAKDIRPAEDVPAFVAELDRYDGRDYGPRVWRHRKKDGTILDVAVTSYRVLWGDRPADVVALEDVSERRRVEERLRLQSAALEAAATGIVITDRRGRIEWVNAAFTAMTGFSRDEAIGQTPRILRSGMHSTAHYADLWATIERGEVWRGLLVNRRKDGTVYDEEQTITPVPGADGAITHFVAIKQDVSDRRRTEAALRRNEVHFRALTEHALDMIALLDAEGRFRYVSPSTERELGYSAAELIGRPALELVDGVDAARVAGLIERGCQSPGTTTVIECRVRRRDGTWRICETVARNLLHDPAVAGIILNTRDMTERRAAEAMQQRLQAQLALSEKLAAMGELLAGVAHELNNPLAIVTGHATLLERSTTDPDVLTRAGKIQEAAERCARIVKNFLALSRQHPPERDAVDLNRVVRETTELLAYPLRVDNVRVALRLADDLPIVNGDRHQLQQVLINLVTNGLHAVRDVAGPRVLTVETRFDAPAERVHVTVTDTGPGVPEEVEARIFEPFYTTKPVGEGTGLGLPICRGIVESHGGTISVERATPQGARFRVELPLGELAEPIDRATGEVVSCEPRRVLVVDDEEDVAQLLAEILTRAGHRVDIAMNGRQAVERLSAATYDVIVSDVKMPDMDGIGLYRAVASRWPALLDRFAFITGDVVNPATALFVETSGAPSLRKPFMVRDVLLLLQRLVR